MLGGSASAFDFLAVAGVELKGAESAVSFDELYGNDAGACIENELLDEGGSVHEGGIAAQLREQYSMKPPWKGAVVKLYNPSSLLICRSVLRNAR